ncbi:hypothetical protein GCM10028805_36970 [Spirosoma harenae]
MIQANEAARQLAGSITLPGTLLEHLPYPFNSPELAQQLTRLIEPGSQTQVNLPPRRQPAFPAEGYECQLLKATPEQVVVSLLSVKRNPEPAYLESVFEALPAGLIVFQAIRQADGQIIDFQAVLCNPVGATITHQPREDILSKTISERYPNMQAYDLFHQYVAVVTTGQPHQQLLYLPTRDLWLDVSVAKYGDGLLVCFQDVTRGQKTAALLESVMSSSPASVRYYEAIRNTEGHIIDFMTSTGNELAAYRPFRPADSTTGKRMLELYPYLKDNGVFDRYVAVVESGQPDQFETSYPLPTRTVWFDCRAVRHGAGFVLTTLDITPQKEAQSEGQRQADLIQGVLNSSKSSIVVLESIADQQDKVVDFQIPLANPATLRLFSHFLDPTISLESVVGQTLLTLFPAVKQRPLFGALLSVVQTKESIHTTVAYQELGLAYEYEILPFQAGLLMITTDITPLRAYQQQLEVSNQALSRSNAYLEQFAAVASHDLQEPLRKIDSFADLLLAQYAPQLDATGQDLLRRQQNAAQRMQALIRGLLDYSRLSTSSLPVESVSLQTLLAEVLTDLEATIQQTRAQISRTSLPTLVGNATQLRQLLQNLVANALKFTKPGQSPHVQITSFPIKAEELPHQPPVIRAESWIGLRVADEGIGFESSSQEHIFELFHRLHGRSQYSGSGIGLAIVKKVVENHGGQITVSSQPGVGAVFTVYLPLQA